MNFIEANQIIKKHVGGKEVPILLASSANVDPLIIYLKAEAALLGQSAIITTLPFGTLGQSLLMPVSPGLKEIIILMPWDIIPECDWRSGIPQELREPDMLLETSQLIINRLIKRNSTILYLDAPIPPVYLNPVDSALLHTGLLKLIAYTGAKVLHQKHFNISSYLSSGLPFTSVSMGELAHESIVFANKPPKGAAKVLITDLDNVMWSGLAAEDGPNGVKCNSEGKGFKHFIYQSFLASLKSNGILLAAVSRNDLDVASAPIKEGYTSLNYSDFIEILASYEPKSVHIKRLAQRLNLGIDSFVFIDDNPIELAEVGAALPTVKCVQFPTADDQLVPFMQELALCFERGEISNEDKQRTEMYRRVLETKPAADIQDEGGDLKEFLLDLKMELLIHDRSIGDRERAIQLINKTNQFNLNGRQFSDEEIDGILASGGKLYTVKLDDRTGTHGEILVCLIDKGQTILSLVLSCRIFQRQVEYAFTIWLIKRHGDILRLQHESTEKNTPLREFLKSNGFTVNGNEVILNGNEFIEHYPTAIELFNIKEVGFD